ncbi:unnamed protein product [Peniophora sp. CBMAI 1063]|nr:unnamed protein product [Peniophora sp. CBMAI 1063]
MSPAPRWLTALKKATDEHAKSTLFQLATVDAQNRPHVRSMINRDFMEVEGKPGLPLLISSTDARTPKTRELAAHSFVELCWWIDASGDQFRIAGRMRIVPSPELGSSLPSSTPAPPDCPALAAYDAAGADWQAKRREQFEAVSEHMRASWCRPPPGEALPGGYPAMDEWPTTVKKLSEAKTDEEKKLSEEAFRNYALVILEPSEVDWVQMAIRPNRRTRFRRFGEEWKEEIIVP